MVLGVTIGLIVLFIFFVQKTVVLRDIDRNDAKHDATESELRPKEYVPRRFRKRALGIMYAISLLLALGLVGIIVRYWPV